MFVGKLPFPGVNQPQIEALILNRNIQWPAEDVLDSIMSNEAKDLINKLIQLEPEKRIGATPESMKELKSHPFFEDIDFEKVSKAGFTGASELVVKLVYKIQMEKLDAEKAEKQKELEAKQNKDKKRNSFLGLEQMTSNKDNTDSISTRSDSAQGYTNLVLKGTLLRENWYRNKQLRYIELFTSGEIKYFSLDKRGART